jgi:hypothetical protein
MDSGNAGTPSEAIRPADWSRPDQATPKRSRCIVAAYPVLASRQDGQFPELPPRRSRRAVSKRRAPRKIGDVGLNLIPRIPEVFHSYAPSVTRPLL